MKKTNKEVLELNAGFQSCGNLKGIKFSYAIAKNLRGIKKEIETIQEATTKLQEEYARKDKKGEKIIIENNIEMKDKQKFNKAYEELMEIENEVTLHKIKQSDLPSDISVQQTTLIFDIIE